MPDFAFELISKAVILFIFNGGTFQLRLKVDTKNLDEDFNKHCLDRKVLVSNSAEICLNLPNLFVVCVKVEVSMAPCKKGSLHQ